MLVHQKTIEQRIIAAYAHLRAGRRYGTCDDVTRAAEKLDSLLDELLDLRPRVSH